MNDQAWMRWVMQTARTWKDISGVIHPIGIEAVDEDHRIFTEYVLELNRVIDAFACRSVCMLEIQKEEAVFLKLMDYAKIHFTREENLMRESGCPLYEAHRKAHAYFAGMLETHWQDFANGRVNISATLKMSILDWWVHHINTMDYKTFIVNACGLE